MPDDEEERLKQLHQYAILDTPAEAEFDRVVRLAQRLFQVPIAFVSFIDRDRQWIKSSIGLDVCESERDISFCAHAILTDDVLVVPDATEDERFFTNPIVTGEMRLRFYAGAPLILRGGYRVGALGIIDTIPRQLSPAEIRSLKDMAAIVVDELELRLLAPSKTDVDFVQAQQLPVTLRQKYEDWIQEHTRHWISANTLLQEEVLQRQRSEAELMASESKYRQLIEQSTDGIFLSEEDGTILEANPAACELLGYCREEVVGANISKFKAPEEMKADASKQQKMASGEYHLFERLLVRSDGSQVPVELGLRKVAEGLFQANIHDITLRKLNEAALQDTNMELEKRVQARTADLYSAVSKLRHEVQERQEAERLLQESNRLLTATLESINDGFYALDKDWRYTYVNASAERITGRPREQLLGRRVFDTHPELMNTVFWDHYRTATETGISSSFEEFYAPGNRWYQVNCYPSNEGISIYFQDISRRKQAEKALQTSKEEAERASEAKTEFLSRMSHELRTPLNAILGFAQLFELDELGPDEHENIQQILRAGRHLLELINEVLDVARVESGQVSFSLEPVSIGQLSQEVVELVRVMAMSHRIKLYNGIGTDGPYVFADRQRFKQVLLNLLANAIKYNHDGGQVDISCYTIGKDRVRVEVHDTGRGMSEENQRKLFRPFERLGIEETDIEGTGIGLALSKRLVELMNGSIGASSVEREGSTFWIELPYANDPVVSTLKEANTLRAGDGGEAQYTVLYIEDNLSNLKLVERILSRHPEIKLIAGMQGGLGLDLAREHRPELILLDLHLPDISGQEVLKRLKSLPETRDIPVVVLSADATPRQIDRLHEEGICDYLTKPINVRRFLSVLNQCLNKEME